MVGFWIFIIVLTICATFVICIFLDNANENFSLWATKQSLSEICSRLERIEKALKKIGEQENDRAGSK